MYFGKHLKKKAEKNRINNNQSGLQIYLRFLGIKKWGKWKHIPKVSSNH